LLVDVDLRASVRAVAVAACVALALAGCTHGASPFGSRGGGAGYVDLDQVVQAHPLHTELDTLQAQITLLNGQAQNAPVPQTDVQRQAQADMEAQLAIADQQFQTQMNARRTYYGQREAAAMAALQAQASGASAPIGQQLGVQAQKIQTDAMKAFTDYQKQLFQADNQHLQQVARQLQQEVGLKIGARRAQLEKQETDYQITLAKQSQSQRLNLKAQLENLNLSATDRQQVESQLANIETREESMINTLKARDNADLKTYEDGLQRDAAARYNAARVASMKQTNDMLQARQKQTNEQLRTQLSGIGTQYQQQVANANAAIAKDPKARAQIDKIHNENQAQYTVEFQKALASYQQTRKQLVQKYSAIAHMQLQDDVALGNEAQALAAQRRDLYAKIVAQVQSQIGSVARNDGLAVVFTNVRGAGKAVDITDQVVKAIAALPAAVPSSSSSAPEVPSSTTPSPAGS
jgi:hypothetical protein